MKKQFIIFGTVVLLICVGLSGCNEQLDTDEESETKTETVEITGIDQTYTINEPDKTITLVISGISNDITVSKETNLVEIILSGTDNIIRVSRSHTFTTTGSGIDNEIVYYD